MSRARSIIGSSAVVVGAAFVAGAVGFVLTFVVARTIGAAATAQFTAFWSAIYLIVGALAGLQQEVARATRPRDGATPAVSLRRFGGVSVVVVVALVVLSGLLWVGTAFAADGSSFLLPLAIGAAGYVLVAIVGGELYGLRRWSSIAAMVVGDAVLRAIAVGVCLLLTHDVVILAWAVALPFGGTLLLLWWFIRRGVTGRFMIDVTQRTLASNGIKAVAGSLATAVLVSGFSLFVVATSPGADRVALGALAFAVTVVRAPVMITVLAAQGLLIVHFRDSERAGRAVLLISAVVLAAGAVLAGLAALIGDPVLIALVGPDFAVGSGVLAVIVAASALMGVLLVTGPFAISRSRHTVYAVAWIVAAVVGIALLFTPLPLIPRVEVSLVAAPVAGILVHVIAALRSRLRSAPLRL